MSADLTPKSAHDAALHTMGEMAREGTKDLDRIAALERRAEVAERALADHRERLARLRGLTPLADRSERYAVAYRRAVGDVLRQLDDLDVEPPPATAPESRALSAALAAYRAVLGIPQREHRPTGLHERAMSAALEAARNTTEGTPDA